MQGRSVAPVVGTISFIFCGCFGSSGPDQEPNDVEPPRFACGYWSPAPPTEDRALLDVYFGRRTAEDPDDRPRAESLELVEQLGGEVVFTYHLPMARVVLEVDRVSELSANFVDGVVDAGTVGADVLVSIATPLSSADRTFLAQIGAKDIEEHRFFVAAWVPDRSIPELRSHAGVRFVEVNGVGCLEGLPN